MKDLGSKRRIAKDILSVILKYRNGENVWIEPFVGGGNMIDKVIGFKRKIGLDINKCVIKALTIIRDKPALLPKSNKEFTKEDFLKAKEKFKKGEDLTSIECWASFIASFGAKQFSSWAKGKSEDYIKEAYNSAQKQSIKLQGCEFYNMDYRKFKYPDSKDTIIYCDIPYKNLTSYKNKFSHEDFYDWVLNMTEKGYKIFISEQNMPNEFECIWTKEIKYTTNYKEKYKTKIEKLFIPKGVI